MKNKKLKLNCVAVLFSLLMSKAHRKNVQEAILITISKRGFILEQPPQPQETSLRVLTLGKNDEEEFLGFYHLQRG